MINPSLRARALLAAGGAFCAAALPFASPALHAQAAGASPVPQLDGRSAPMALPIARDVPEAQDTAWPGGPLTLDIDARDIERGLYRVSETVPVAAGTREIVLQLPQWIPGGHKPEGTISEIVGLSFTADGKPLRWWRDPVEVFAFHVALPEGARAVTARFIDTSPLQAAEGRITMTREMLNLQWDRMSLYPAGHYTRRIRVVPSVTLPAGWQAASALDGRKADGARLSWAETDYATLVDSPVFAGANFKRFELGHDVALNVVADKAEQLAIRPENLARYRAMVEEALALFGTRHFDHYDFLLALSDRLGGIGLEHHRSSENSMEPRSFVDWAGLDWNRNVIPHEFVHSWNGKFRRPARLWTPDYRQPMQDNLLWVYEGQTQFWGMVLAARSGVQSRQAVLGMMASYAGMFSQWPGREWRSVEDTTHDPIVAARRPKPFVSMARSEDYYTEGALVWLEADQIIRAGTQGRRGLDDFARAFFGQREGDWGEVPYAFEDVVSALNGVYPYDWASFLHQRMETAGQKPPLAGIEQGGYALVWKADPNPYDAGRMAQSKTLNLQHSLGIILDRDGRVISCRWDSPAFNAALVTGSRVIAVNGIAYDADTMRGAITAAKGTTGAISLIVQRGDRVQTVSIDYHDGLRYPWLEKAGPAPAGLDALLAPRRGEARP